MPTIPDPMTEAYLALVRRFPLEPIQDETGLDRAIALLDELLDRDDLRPEEDDYLHDLGTLVHEYEEVHWPMPPDPEGEDDEASPEGTIEKDPAAAQDASRTE